ncbi:MAG: hypothetical protein U1A77_18260 [Pirellulales bacterium]
MSWVLGTAWACAVFQLAAVLLGIAVKGVVDSGVNPRASLLGRLFLAFWTIGCLGLAAHMAAAFHFVHNWSHLAAWEHTAKRTAEEFGFYWGDGIYANYLALAVWVIDVSLRFWRVGCMESQGESLLAPAQVAAHGWNWAKGLHGFHRVTYGYLLFLQFQATVVFGGFEARLFGGILFLIAAALGVSRWRQASRAAAG